MADSTEVRGGQDRTRINTNQEHELRYWTKELQCTPEELTAAVKAVGSSVDKVRQYMNARSR